MPTTVDNSNPDTQPQRKSPEKQTSREQAIVKFTELHRAKKMVRRARHRATLKRSNTKG